MGRNSSLPLLLLFLFLISLLLVVVCFQPTMGCIQRERESLLEFKSGLHDPSGRLSSWAGNYDCCRWIGVKCSNRTGHVVRLDLRNPFPLFDAEGYLDSRRALGGDINPSLLGLKHLKYLDFSKNSFKGSQIPTFIGSLKRLKYLNLSSAGFNGPVPHQLGNLSSLRYLDLSMDEFYLMDTSNMMYMDSGRWLSNLSSLQYLNLGGVDLSGASDRLLESLNRLPSLSEMHLSNCELYQVSLHLSHANFTSLRVLDLHDNNINSTIPQWLFKIIGLNYLDLSGNSFQGLIIPDSIGNLTSLQVLDLSYNNRFIQRIPATLGDLCMLSNLDLSFNEFGGELNEVGETLSTGCIKDSLETLSWSYSNLSGKLPDWLGKFKNLKSLQLSGNSFYGPIPASLHLSSSLRRLYLDMNKLNGTLPETIWQLSELHTLDLNSNSLKGVITEAHLSNLTRLESLDLYNNSLALDVGSNWVPPPHLTYIGLGSCKVGPAFPAWLRQLENLSYIRISNAGISDTMPDWFWNFSSKVSSIILTDNEIKGKLPSSLTHLINLEYIDLSNNLFEGPLPQFSSSLWGLHLSNNSISGIIYPNIGELTPNIRELSISANDITGSIPLSICKLKYLEVLDFSRNHLSGEIPNCGDDDLPSLESLHLSGNDLSGELPLTLRNCERMVTLDLGHNKFSGIIPTWIGESFPYLEDLRLRSNLLVGNIPPQLGNLEYLQLIDLAHNNLSGTIPPTFGNLSAMKVSHKINHSAMLDYFNYYVDNLDVNMKGREDKYDALLSLVVSIDLAGNDLIGWIPEELTTLYGLLNLNLSGNHLTGKISEKISGLQWLESLDLSINNLSGIIPTSMTTMHSLNHLNLSFNQFSGKIPSGGQLQALPDPSIYTGNHQLCGFPLNIKCQDDGTSQPPQPMMTSSDESDSEMEEIYLGMGVGFVVSCWTVYGTLLVKKKWRIAYFRFVDDMYDKIYVALAINMARMKNKCYFNSG